MTERGGGKEEGWPDRCDGIFRRRDINVVVNMCVHNELDGVFGLSVIGTA